MYSDLSTPPEHVDCSQIAKHRLGSVYVYDVIVVMVNAANTTKWAVGSRFIFFLLERTLCLL
jgi:hypothetical protein